MISSPLKRCVLVPPRPICPIYPQVDLEASREERDRLMAEAAEAAAAAAAARRTEEARGPPNRATASPPARASPPCHPTAR